MLKVVREGTDGQADELALSLDELAREGAKRMLGERAGSGGCGVHRAAPGRAVRARARAGGSEREGATAAGDGGIGHARGFDPAGERPANGRGGAPDRERAGQIAKAPAGEGGVEGDHERADPEGRERDQGILRRTPSEVSEGHRDQ